MGRGSPGSFLKSAIISELFRTGYGTGDLAFINLRDEIMDNFHTQAISQDQNHVTPTGRVTLPGKRGQTRANYLNGDAQSVLAGYRNTPGEITHEQE